MKEMRGSLIVFEGCDKTGKSTQSKLLYDRLFSDNRKVKLCRFPERSTTIGKLINDYLMSSKDLDDHSIHLLFSANRWELRSQLLDDINKGVSVIIDRYAYSGVCFTAAKGLDVSWCKSPDIGLPMPDCVLFLDISKELLAQRLISDKSKAAERYEKLDFQLRVMNNYKLLSDPTWQNIDASRSVNDIHEDIYNRCLDVLESPKSPVKELWKTDAVA